MVDRTRLILVGACVGSLTLLIACESKTPTPPTPTTPTPPKSAGTASGDKHDDHAGHDHAAGDKHDDHDHADGDKHDDHDSHGPTVVLGNSAIGAFAVVASRAGEVKPGGEVAVDVDITPAAGAAAKVASIRVWIGTQDAKGSLKAKLDSGHGHVEVPNPMPAEAKLWVEVEDDKGTKSVGSFDLKA